MCFMQAPCQQERDHAEDQMQPNRATATGKLTEQLRNPTNNREAYFSGTHYKYPKNVIQGIPPATSGGDDRLGSACGNHRYLQRNTHLVRVVIATTQSIVFAYVHAVLESKCRLSYDVNTLLSTPSLHIC